MTQASASEVVSVGRRSTAIGKESSLAAPSLSIATTPFSLRTGAALPREILAWLQSLQLGGSVKYPKRDLANGYVIAHICARYWPHVPLHSFENKAGAASKQSNWFVLQKVLRQKGVDVSAAMVDGMMNGADDCASTFLQQLYTVLTGKHADTEAVPLEDALPDVPASKVPVYVPTSTGGAAARTRHVGGANGPGLSAKVDSRSDFMGGGNKAASLFGAAAADVRILDDTSSKDVRNATPVLLPPLQPSLPMPAHTQPATSPASGLTEEAAAASKPFFNVAVRAAWEVSTVLLTQQASASAAEDAAGAPIPVQVSSLAGSWFCMKVREAVPVDALEALMEGDEAALAPRPSLSATLRWLSAVPSGDGGVEGEMKAALWCTGGDGHNVQQALLRTGAWQAILGAVPELAQILVHHGGHGLDALVDCLFASVMSAQSRIRGGGEGDAGGGASFAFVRNAVHFSAVLLATLSDLDVYHAIACFETYFAASPTFVQALRGLRWSLAADYATVITAVLPANRRLAATVLSSLWGTIEYAVRDSAAEETALYGEAAAGDGESNPMGAEDMAEVCLLVLLRTLLTSLQPISAGASSRTPLEAPISSHAQIEASGRAMTSAVRRTAPCSSRNTTITASTSQDAVSNTLVQLAEKRSAAVLQQSVICCASATGVGVDEALVAVATEKEAAAVALAVQVLRMELHPSLMAAWVAGGRFFDVYNALFPSSDNAATPTPPNASSPTLSVLRARWLRWCLQRRFELSLSSPSPATSAAAAMSLSPLAQQRQRVSHAVAPFGVRDGGGHRATTTTLAQAHDLSADSAEMRALLTGVQVLCHELSSVAESLKPADAQSRVLVACALAESLPFLPARYKAESTGADGGSAFAEDAAEAAFKVLMHEATPAQMRSILACASELRAGAAVQRGGELEDEAQWMVHRYVGPLKPSGLLVVESDALLLVKAALGVLSSGGDHTGNSGGSRLSPSFSGAGDRDVKLTGGTGGARRLAARAAVMAREGQVDEKIAERVRWLASLLVEGRACVRSGTPPLFPWRSTGDSGAVRRSPSSLREDTATVASAASEAEVLEWQAVLSHCYEDLVLVIQAASSRLRQRGGAGAGGNPNAAETHFSEVVGKELLMLAQKAEGVVCSLWRELAPILAASAASRSKSESEQRFIGAATPSVVANSALISSPPFSFLEDVSHEEVATAVRWICAVAGV
ncbi:conserved hypothetical protein [Leishmania major strain Friedlin]|uniref:CH-like domain-containing protein n=1 Tax=Leishmania major TaxID=5664 RepID=Q4QHB0_LEIMA|nr:conserved hypothetical protein [Leishmania major strain Friedlin]CAG9570088.1 Domain_of_Unknown_Function_(DUF1042)_-_putative [Leishmania major strain Friedlin]CAJ02939.1 conserved hypothetical protein [Leishmania major strain Friedlin]|eukprot:XP_001681438.1 conserved hypothetical protein [Leishmania major strain Friedlin]